MAYTLVKRVGGKYKLREWIKSYIPQFNIFTEPFGGSFAVGLSLPEIYDSKKRIVFNDLDKHLVNFFDVCRNNTEELANAINLSPYSREDFLAAHRTIHETNEWEKLDKVERARQYLIANRQSFSGKEDGSWSTSKKGENIAHTWNNLPPLIIEVGNKLKHVYVECMDYREVLTKWDTEETIHYIDPPYLDVEEDFYHVNIKAGGFNHGELRDSVAELKGSWIISYYDSPEIRKLYDGFTFYSKEVYKHMQTGDNKTKATEVLIVHYSDWGLNNLNQSQIFKGDRKGIVQ